MTPGVTHYDNPYQVTVSGNGTIYYTTDGSLPTLSSSSAVNNVQININQTKEIKAFLVNGSGTTSAVFSKKYYTGTIPTASIYFKAPSNWTNGGCVMVDMVSPNAINGFAIDTLWPGFTMTDAGCEGWYKTVRNFENANVRFNNCSPFENIPGSISTNLIPMGSTLYYDFTDGVISNPPSCVNLNITEANKNNIVLIKVYPNPVSDILKINTDKDFKEFEIFDLSGKIISKNKFSSKEIPIYHLTTGKYFIKLKDGQGNITLLNFIKK